MNKKAFYRRESFLLNIFTQAIIGLMVAHIYLQRGSLPASHLLIVLLLFSFLLWHTPSRGNPRKSYLYLTVQFLFACLLFTQDWLFMYLFLILTGHVMVMRDVSTRDSLIGVGVFVGVTLYGTFHPYTADLTTPPLIRAVVVTVGFILAGILSNSVARARRNRRELNRALAEIQDAHARLQTHIDQAASLAMAEKRNHLARELHDTLGHRLTVAIVQVEGASRLMEQEPQRVARMLETVQMQLTDGLNELRYTLKELRTTNSNGNDPSRSQQRIADEGRLGEPEEKLHD